MNSSRLDILFFKRSSFHLDGIISFILLLGLFSINLHAQTLSVSPDSLKFTSFADSGQFNVISDISWTVSGGAGWITVSPSADSGNAAVTVSVTENVSTAPRSADLTVSTGGLSETVTVTQSGAAETLSVSTNSLDFTAAAGSASFDVTSNTAWTVSGGAGWITVSPSADSGNAAVTVSVTENVSTAPRSADLTVSTGGLSETVTVTQSGADPILTADPDSLVFSAASGTKSFTVMSNTNWSASETVDWVTLSLINGSGDALVDVSVSENLLTSPRSTNIIVSGDGLIDTVTVIQQGRVPDPQLSVTPSNRNVSATAGTTSFEVSNSGGGTLEWSVSESANWLTITSGASGTGSGTIQVSYDENPTTDPRSAIVTVSSTNAINSPVEVTVEQSGADPTLTLNIQNLDFGSIASSNSFNIISNISWTVSVNAEWITVNPEADSGDGTVTVNVTENLATSSRNTVITVSGSSLSETITVNQAGADPILAVSTDTLIFGSGSGSNSFDVTSNTNWTLTENAAWITPSTTADSGNVTVTVDVNENSSITPRSADIIVSDGNIVQTVTVTQQGQSAEPFITISRSTIDFGSLETGKSKQDSFTVQNTGDADLSGTISLSNGNSFSIISGGGTYLLTPGETLEVVLTFTPATTGTESGIVEVAHNANNQASPAQVSLSGEGVDSPVLSVSPLSRDVGAASGTTTFDISNSGGGTMEWSAEENSGWVIITSGSSGTGSGTITLSYDANRSTETRSATITVSSTNADNSPVQVTVNQEGAGVLTVNYSSGWNLVSIPIDIAGQQFTDFFSSINNNLVYELNGQYQEATSVEAGKGYWIKLESEETAEFNGTRIDELTLILNRGWNLIGTIASSLSVPGDIQDSGNILVDGTVWVPVFDPIENSYNLVETDQMVPGKGYFIQAGRSGEITLSNK